MSAKAERPRNRTIRIVGGGTRKARQSNSATSGGSLKAQRRAIRQQMNKSRKGRARKLTVAEKSTLKQQLADLLRRKDKR